MNTRIPRRSTQTFECGHCIALQNPYTFLNTDLLNEAVEDAKRRSAKCKGQSGCCGNLLKHECYNKGHRCQSCYNLEASEDGSSPALGVAAAGASRGRSSRGSAAGSLKLSKRSGCCLRSGLAKEIAKFDRENNIFDRFEFKKLKS